MKGLTAYNNPDVKLRKYLRYRKTAETINNYLPQFDLLRKVAASRLGSDCTLPDAFTATLREALGLASARDQIDLMGVSRRMRPLIGRIPRHYESVRNAE